MEATDGFTYPGNRYYELTIHKSHCNSCSSRQTPAWNNVTILPTYGNFTAIDQIKTTIRRPSFSSRYWTILLIRNIRNAISNIVLPSSLVTNSLSIAVFIYMRRKIQSNLFLVFVSLSVVDTFALSLKFNVAVASISRKMALLYYNVGCQMLRWLESCGQTCSSWLVFLYTFERFISVRFPLKHTIICSGRRIRIALLCILVFIPISLMYNLILFEHKGRSCGVPFRNQRKIIYRYIKLVQFMLGILLPYICIAFLNGMIVYNLISHGRKRAALQASTVNSEERTHRSMTAMLIAASTFSLITMMPLIISTVADAFYRSTSMNFGIFSLVALHIISPWNYCGNFIFYVIGGKQFRNALFNMILCRHPSGKYNTTDTVH